MDLKPNDIMTAAAFENAMVMIMATGGSTNAVTPPLSLDSAHIAIGLALEPLVRYTPYSLHSTPYTLHPTPYTLHPLALHQRGDSPLPSTNSSLPYTRNPAPSTLNPKPEARNASGAWQVLHMIAIEKAAGVSHSSQADNTQARRWAIP